MCLHRIAYNTIPMTTNAHWRDPEGVSIIKSVISKKISHWSDGLRPVQLEAVSRFLMESMHSDREPHHEDVRELTMLLLKAN